MTQEHVFLLFWVDQNFKLKFSLFSPCAIPVLRPRASSSLSPPRELECGTVSEARPYNRVHDVSESPVFSNTHVGYKETCILYLLERSLIAVQLVIEMNEIHSLIRKKKKMRGTNHTKAYVSSNSQIIFLVYFVLQLHKPSLLMCPSIRYLLCFCTKNKDAFINSRKSVGQTIHAVKPPKTLSANNEIHQWQMSTY